MPGSSTGIFIRFKNLLEMGTAADKVTATDTGTTVDTDGGIEKADSHIACRYHAAPMPFPYRAVPCRQWFRMCLSHLIYTVRPCLIHTCHAMPMPCSDHAVLLKATAWHGRRETAVLCCDLQKNDMVGAWHGKCESDTAALCKSNGKNPWRHGTAGERYGRGMGTTCYV